jgi:hypothetical protein
MRDGYDHDNIGDGKKSAAFRAAVRLQQRQSMQ